MFKSAKILTECKYDTSDPSSETSSDSDALDFDLEVGAMSSRGLEIPSFRTSHFLHASRSVEVWNCTGNHGLFHPFPLSRNPCHSLLCSTLLEVWKGGILTVTN